MICQNWEADDFPGCRGDTVPALTFPLKLLFKSRPSLSDVHVRSSSTLTMMNRKDARGDTVVSLALTSWGCGSKPSICAGLEL